MKYRVTHLLPLVAAATALCTAPLHATSYTFVGGSGSNLWTDQTIWSPHGVPGTGDSVTIPDTSVEGTGILATDVTVADITISGTTIDLEGTYTVTHDLEWQAGSISGGLLIAQSGTLNITGTNDKTLGEFSIVTNSGYATWTGSGQILGASDCFLKNNGTFVSAADNSFGYSAGTNTATFQNNGTFIKNGGDNTTYIGNYWAYSGTGAITVTTGTVQLGTVSNQSHFFGDGTVISGPNDVLVTDAINVEGTVHLNTGATLEIDYGAQLGSDGDGTTPSTANFTGPGTLAWTGGTFESGYYGTGIIATGTDTQFIIIADGSQILDAFTTLNNYGHAIWLACPTLEINGATFNNYGTFTAQDNATLTKNSAGTFNNYGTFTKTSSGTTIFDGVDFYNFGTLSLTDPDGKISSNSLYIQGPSALFKIALSGTHYSALSTTSDVALSGTLQVTVPTGQPKPTKGTVASVLGYGTLDTGGFAVSVPVGVKLKPKYTATALQLVIQDHTKPLALAALSGKVQGVTTTNPTGTTLQVKGKFVVRNTGNAAAGRFKVDLYSSTSTDFSPSNAQYVQTFVVPGLAAGASHAIPFKTTVPSTNQEYLIFDIDAQNKVIELNRDNDTVLYTAPYSGPSTE